MSSIISSHLSPFGPIILDFIFFFSNLEIQKHAVESKLSIIKTFFRKLLLSLFQFLPLERLFARLAYFYLAIGAINSNIYDLFNVRVSRSVSSPITRKVIRLCDRNREHSAFLLFSQFLHRE